MSEVSDQFERDFTSPIADYSQVLQMAPGMFSYSSNGVGLGDNKTTMRGLPDSNSVISFDGIPFNDTNGVSHPVPRRHRLQRRPHPQPAGHHRNPWCGRVNVDSKGIDLGVDAAAASVAVQVRVDGMVVMLSNLVDNALRYTQRDGRVDVSAGTLDGRPYLRVADNGPGVPAAERVRLFDRFYRPDGNAVWGCGLGMSIVKSVADDHDAEVSLESNADGRGLVVTIRLPVDALSTPA